MGKLGKELLFPLKEHPKVQEEVALPFGTQDFRFFDDAEHFDIVADDSNSLKAAAKKCEQGKDFDESWIS